MWKIEKIVSKGDYLYAIVKEHPRATVHGYVLHHRIVMENCLGRLLDKDEIVHHKDGNGKNNDPSNLQVMNVIEHRKLHAQEIGRKYVLLKCPACKKMFEKQHNQTHLAKPSRTKSTSCSRKCRGKLSSSIQYNGLTHEVETAVSGNILAQYVKYGVDNPEETI